jgi:hypothetical protein
MERPEPPTDVLTPLIAGATDLCDAGTKLIDALRSNGGTGATLPESTVVRLHFVAASTYRSGILCLWMAETSLASYSLIRGLLEIWAHLTFIERDSFGGSAACRALRYERGAMSEWSSSLKKAPGYYDSASWQASHDEKKNDIDGLWRDLECTGAPRTRNHVKQTLDLLAKESNMEWIPGMWSASSASTHAYGVDFMMDSSKGETEFVWASPSQRASWFAFTVATFAYLTVTAAGILSSGDVRIASFHGRARELLDDNVLRRIARHEFDARAGTE